MRRIVLIVVACLCTLICFSQIKRSEKLVTFSGSKYYLHKVEKGQTLYAISKAYVTTVNKLLLANKKKNASLREGELLKIPYVEGKRVVQSLKYKHYIVKKGDTLWSLSKKFGTTEQELIELNAGVEVALVEGRRLIVPVVAESQDSYDADYYYHTVKKGETLSRISRHYGLSVKQLKKYNKNIKSNRIRKGDEIRIPIENARAEVAKVRSINKKTLGQKEVFVEKDNADKKYTPLTKIPKSWKGEPYEKYENISEGFDDNENTEYTPNFESQYKMLLLLPLKNSSNRMLNYYKGMLLAMKENKDVPVAIDVFDSEKSGRKVASVLQKHKDVDFIVGPYSERVFKGALPYAKGKKMIVSLLSKNNAVYENPAVLQINTTEKTINKRIATYVVDKHFSDNVVLFNGHSFEKYRASSAGREDKITQLYNRINAVRDGRGDSEKDYQEAFKPYFDKDKKNIVIVPISDYRLVSQVLNALSVYSVNDVEVIGYYKWKLLPNIAPEMLFNLNVTYFTPFHYVETEQEAFVKGYKERFQSFPDDFSYMGYVTMSKLLKGIKSGGSNFYKKPLLKITKHKNGGYENIDLKKVQFKSDYSVVAE
ncbi:MAG: LysM peptidoglycan-binding domain-containing protein [Flavobacteriaceae bacterium]|nr:LysM peptidoglycan-binding domain-containing protein [Flavobacteriaceae bacterium]